MVAKTNSEVSMLAALVAFDTTSHKSNMDLIAFVQNYLSAHGVNSQLIPTPDGDKASLFATIGPPEMPGIGLSGHTDVVPVEGQSWDSDPFALVERDDKFYGRGTCDMKGFLACALASVPGFTAAKLKTPIHIVFSYDEETGCTGVRPMIEQFGKELIKPRIVIVGEPTNMTVVDAHKGPTRLEVRITGRAAHSSMAHLGANPVMAAGRLITELSRIETELKQGPLNTRFTPPFCTLQVNTIEGGQAQNVIPTSCAFSIDIRTLPGISATDIADQIRAFAISQVLPDLQAAAPEASIDIVEINHVPAFAAANDSAATSLALQLAGQNETLAVSYATEAGWFEPAGAASIVCGPGDIAQAHTANEFIERRELDKCMNFMRNLADWASR